MGNIDNLVSEYFAVACQDVQRAEVTKRSLDYRRDKGMRKLPDEREVNIEGSREEVFTHSVVAYNWI